MMPTVLLTGATGFLGSHLAPELLRRGYAVRALARPGSNRQLLAHLPIEWITGALGQPEVLQKAAVGCGSIVHAAALATVNPARNPALWAVNEAGTRHVLEAARRADVARLVYVGTANVFGFGSKDQPGDETRPFAGARYGLDYMDSKRAATQLVQRAVTDWQLPAVLVHPTFMLGPMDRKPTSGQLLIDLHQGRLPGYPAGGKNYVHVGDVSVAVVNALTRGQIGASYIAGNQNMTYREAFGLMADVMQVPPPRWRIPPALARLYGYGSEWAATLTHRPARLNPAMCAVANDGHYFSSQKAITDLAMPQTPVRRAVEEAFAWFRENKYV